MMFLPRATALLVVPALGVAPPSARAQDPPPAAPDTTWHPFAPGVVSLPDIRETSPSVTADGQTMLFARTESWRDKVPYLATRPGGGWDVVEAPFADTLYNLAVAPDGQSVFFKAYDMQNGEEVSRAYRVERTADGWGPRQPLPNLFNINAGYFCPMADGTLYFFARVPRPGIYVAEPDGRGGYDAPQWLSDAVSPEGTTSFDVPVHPDEDRLIITRAGIPDDRSEELGPRGFYVYRRTAGRRSGASPYRTAGGRPCYPTDAFCSLMTATCKPYRSPSWSSAGSRIGHGRVQPR